MSEYLWFFSLGFAALGALGSLGHGYYDNPRPWEYGRAELSARATWVGFIGWAVSFSLLHLIKWSQQAMNQNPRDWDALLQDLVLDETWVWILLSLVMVKVHIMIGKSLRSRRRRDEYLDSRSWGVQ